MAYSDQVMDHYNNPRNVGRFDKEEKNIGTGMVGAPACGDVMQLQIKVTNGIIEEARFKTYGCGSAIASSSLLTEWVKGRNLEEAGNITNVDIAEELALPPVKIHCSVLAEDAIKEAIKNYKENDPHTQVMYSLLSSASLTLIDRIGLNFALAHTYESLENHEKQFKFLNEANRLRKKESNYSIDKDLKRFSVIKELFKNPPLALKKDSSQKINFLKVTKL